MWPYWLAQFPLKDAGLYGKLIHYIQSCFLCQQIRYFISPFVFFQIDIKNRHFFQKWRFLELVT